MLKCAQLVFLLGNVRPEGATTINEFEIVLGIRNFCKQNLAPFGLGVFLNPWGSLGCLSVEVLGSVAMVAFGADFVWAARERANQTAEYRTHFGPLLFPEWRPRVLN